MQDMQEQASSRLLTVQQVQDLLGVDASTIYRMASDGRLPAVKIGRQWRFRADRISALLDGPRDEAPPSPRQAPESATIQPPASRAALRTDIAEPVIDAAADLLGVMMVVTDMSGQPVTHVANPCPRFAEHADDPDIVAACAEEWRELADDLEFEPRFTIGHLGFECARAFVRSGNELVGMVLVGGVAPQDPAGPVGDDLYRLDAARRDDVLAALRKVAVTLSRAATIGPDRAAPADPRDDATVAARTH